MPNPRMQCRTGKNEEKWLQNHLWCPNDPRGYGIDDDDDEVGEKVFHASSTVRNATLLTHKFSRQLSAFSPFSSGHISALLVLSVIYLFMKVFLSPDIILCG